MERTTGSLIRASVGKRLLRRGADVASGELNQIPRLLMRLLKAFIFILCCWAMLIAQDKHDVTSKYGTLVSETYLKNPGLYVTVVRNDAGVVCGLRIAPADMSGFLLRRAGAQDIPEVTLAGIVEELVPLTERGKLIQRFVSNTSCVSDPENPTPCEGNGDVAEYENVSIFIARSNYKDKKRYAEIRWNKSKSLN